MTRHEKTEPNKTCHCQDRDMKNLETVFRQVTCLETLSLQSTGRNWKQWPSQAQSPTGFIFSSSTDSEERWCRAPFMWR